MNTAFLGDALDHWKGSLFESLQNAGVLMGFGVDPMASDLREWEQEDFDLYARLLRVELHQILQHEIGITGARHEYFQSVLKHAGDLFLDPDIGVATGRVRDPEHVMPVEIGHLLHSGTKRIVALYQHVRGRRVAHRVDEVLGAIREQIGEFGWSSYESGSVAMLFLSRDCDRAAAVSEHFRRILGSRADGRIRPGWRLGLRY